MVEIYFMDTSQISAAGAKDLPRSSSGDASAATEKMTLGSKRALIAAMSGTLIEWYDYALYGAASSLVIAPLFFADVGAGATLAAFATFAVGFIARPLGGVLVGHIGDRYGRRPAMLLTILVMGFATVGIGLLPTAAAIGTLAPVLLVILRLLQGMGAGAELSGAMTIVAEFAPPKRRGILTSLVLATPPAGIALATVAFLLASSAGDETLLAWAWRIPFLVSVFLFAVAIFIRRKLEETPEYVAAQKNAAERGERAKTPLAILLRKHRRPLAVGFLAMTGHNAINYALAVFAISLMTSHDVGLSRTAALVAVTLGSLVGVVTTPLGGWAADRFGAGKTVAFGSIVGAIVAYPILEGLSSGSALLGGLAVAVGYALVIAFTSGGQGSFLAGLFPPRERFSGIALARELNGALIAGFTPLILTWLLGIQGSLLLPAVYLSVCCVLSAVAVVLAPKTIH